MRRPTISKLDAYRMAKKAGIKFGKHPDAGVQSQFAMSELAAIAICHVGTCCNREAGRIPEAIERVRFNRSLLLLPSEPTTGKTWMEVNHRIQRR